MLLLVEGVLIVLTLPVEARHSLLVLLLVINVWKQCSVLDPVYNSLVHCMNSNNVVYVNVCIWHVQLYVYFGKTRFTEQLTVWSVFMHVHIM